MRTEATHAPQCMHFMGLASFPMVMAPTKQAFSQLPHPVQRSCEIPRHRQASAPARPQGRLWHTERHRAAACHHTKVAFNSALGLDLDGAVLQRDSACASPAACEHAAQAAYAALRVGHLQTAALLLFLLPRTLLSLLSSLQVLPRLMALLLPGSPASSDQLPAVRHSASS